MSDEYEFTPSTEQVRSHYVFNQGDQWSAERGEKFDRWLAARDREIAVSAWNRGKAAGILMMTAAPGTYPPAALDNPFAP